MRDCLAGGLNRMGASCEALPDGLVIEGPTRAAAVPLPLIVSVTILPFEPPTWRHIYSGACVVWV